MAVDMNNMSPDQKAVADFIQWAAQMSQQMGIGIADFLKQIQSEHSKEMSPHGPEPDDTGKGGMDAKEMYKQKMMGKM